MDARYFRAALAAAACCLLGASYRTENFIVSAPTEPLAREIGEAAEQYRQGLAVEWLGHELPRWNEPCPITASVSPQLGAGGATSFMFHQGHPRGWTMTIQGSRERLLDSVLPHEVTHTIFATHFGQPLPRWADEGACTTVEHTSEKAKQEKLLYQFLTTNRGIAFNQMFAMREYPADILPLYAQGYSLARYLIQQGGKRKFIEYVGEGLANNNWPAATQHQYGYRSLADLQLTWLEWVRGGMPELPARPGRSPETVLASAELPSKNDDQRLYPAPPRSLGVARTDGNSAVSLAPPTPRAGSMDARTSVAAGDSPMLNVARLSNIEYGRSGGWYAKQQEAPRVAATENNSKASSASLATVASPGDDILRAATRPQPIEQPRQTVLEWTAPSNSAVPAFTPIVPTTPAASYPSYSAVPSATIRR